LTAWGGGASEAGGGESCGGEATTTEGGEGSAWWDAADEKSRSDEAGTGRTGVRPQDPRTTARSEQDRAERTVSEKGYIDLREHSQSTWGWLSFDTWTLVTQAGQPQPGSQTFY